LFLPKRSQGCMKIVPVYAHSIAVPDENKFRGHWLIVFFSSIRLGERASPKNDNELPTSLYRSSE